MRRTSGLSRAPVPLVACLVVSCGVGGPRSPALPSHCAPPTLFDYERTAPLDVEVDGTVDGDGWSARRLSFRGAEGGRVPAMSWQPEGGPSGPAILLAHGMPGHRGSLAPLAEAYARAGVTVFSITAPFSRAGSPLRRPSLFTLPLFDAGDRTELVRYVRDLRRALDLALRHPGVDPEAMGFVGHSYGGTAGAILSGVEPRIRAFALAAAIGSLADRFRDPWEAGRVTPLGERPMGSTEWTRTLREVDARCYLGSASPGSLLLQFGARDSLVDARAADRLAEAAPAGSTVLRYEAGHALRPSAWSDQATWLATRLGFDPTRFEPPDLR